MINELGRDVIMKPKLLFIAVLLLVSCSPIRGCMESSFTLTPESRLPKWFPLPTGYTRDAVTVKSYYYSSPFPVDNAVFELTDQNDKLLMKATGKTCWHPETKKKRNKYGGLDPDSYPHYVYVRVNGTLEVIEHIKGPTFRIIDDQKLFKEALESNECN